MIRSMYCFVQNWPLSLRFETWLHQLVIMMIFHIPSLAGSHSCSCSCSRSLLMLMLTLTLMLTLILMLMLTLILIAHAHAHAYAHHELTLIQRIVFPAGNPSFFFHNFGIVNFGRGRLILLMNFRNCTLLNIRKAMVRKSRQCLSVSQSNFH
jgi:hypothetical protein